MPEDEGSPGPVCRVWQVCWLWVALAYLLKRYASINWAARYFAAAFLIEAGQHGACSSRISLPGYNSALIGLRVDAAYPAASLPFFLSELLAVILIAAPIAMRFTPDDPATSTPIQSPPEAGRPVEAA